MPYSKLSDGDPNALNKLAVLKVNGGLGTSMGTSSLYAFLPIHRSSFALQV